MVEELEHTKACRLCGNDFEGYEGNLLCGECLDISKDYSKIREYVNSLEEINEGLICLFDVSINDRVSMIISFDKVKIDTTLDMVKGSFKGVKADISYKGQSVYAKNIIEEIELLKKGKKQVLEALNS